MQKPDPSKICFGLTEELDRSSFSTFLELAGNKEFAQSFANKLSSKEIIATVDQLMLLIRTHLSEQEYHSLFLGDHNHHHHIHPKE